MKIKSWNKFVSKGVHVTTKNNTVERISCRFICILKYMRGSRNFRRGGGGGPGQSDKKKNSWRFFVFFIVLSLFLQKSKGQLQRNLSFFKVSEGSNIFQGGSNFFQGGGGGVQLLIPYRNPYNLWFSREGGPDPLSPPSGSALEIEG